MKRALHFSRNPTKNPAIPPEEGVLAAPTHEERNNPSQGGGAWDLPGREGGKKGFPKKEGSRFTARGSRKKEPEIARALKTDLRGEEKRGSYTISFPRGKTNGGKGPAYRGSGLVWGQ